MPRFRYVFEFDATSVHDAWVSIGLGRFGPPIISGSSKLTKVKGPRKKWHIATGAGSIISSSAKTKARALKMISYLKKLDRSRGVKKTYALKSE